MSSPTPGSDANHPQGQPQGQPGWGAPQQPAQGYGDPAQSYSGAPAPAPAPAGGQRPGMVTTAGIIGIVIGGLGLLSIFGIGLLFAFDAVLGLLSLLSFAAAVVLLVGGIQVLMGKSPKLLLLGSYASIGIQLLTLIWALVSGWGFLFAGLLGCILPVVIVLLLRQSQSKQYYTSRGISY